jgi:hypothetical protein
MEETALPMANSAVSGAGLVQVDPPVAAAEALVPMVVIRTDGLTSLLQVGRDYYVDAGVSGQELKYGGAAVTSLGPLLRSVPCRPPAAMTLDKRIHVLGGG